MIRLLSRLTVAAVIATTVAAADVSAQSTKRALDHDSYDIWNRIQGRALSPDGNWLAYVVNPGEGDGNLILVDTRGERTFVLPQGTAPSFSDDSRYLVATVRPATAAVEEARERRRDDRSVQLPNSGLAIIPIDDVFNGTSPNMDAVVRMDDVQSFRLPDEGAAVVAYLLEEADDGGSDRSNEEESEETELSPREKRRADKSDGATLVLRDLASGAEHRFEHVVAYTFTEDGSRLYFTASSKDGSADGVMRIDTSNGTAQQMVSGEGRYLRLAISDGESGSGAVAFLTDRDDQEAEEPALSLYVADASASEAQALVRSNAAGIPEGWWVGDSAIRFSDEGRRIFFGTDERPEPVSDDENDGEDEVVLDVWNWKDDYLQPMQLINAEREENRTYEAMVAADGGTVMQLETQEFENTTVPLGGDANVAVATSNLPYRQLVSWDGRYSDIYLLDLESGQRELALEMMGRGANFSPSAEHLFWFDGIEKQWFAMDVESRDIVDMTSSLPYAVHNELDDHPDEPPPYGSAGWTEDGHFLVYDAYDIWSVDPAGVDAPRNLTEGAGRRDGLRFRYQPVDPDTDFVPTDADVLLTAFHLTEKDAGFYKDRFDGRSEPEQLVLSAHRYGGLQKAEDADNFVLTRQTFQDFPDLYVADAELSSLTRLSEANPQQSEYRWGSAEIYEWTSNDGDPLQGILYKPEGFDPNEEYPMMVYFYERSSDGLHGYTVPAAGGSSINRSFYVSRGYLLFVPDIPYEIGFPGESAIDAVIPGVLSLIDEGFVKADKIGVQGHSWGGYQISHMITRSNIFAAAEAGAPVANMTSAYGGIRWGSGMSRMFQYERTQSRIGGTLWNAQHRYIENSPIFFADKVHTPLLMMHNDEDGAVPWYQGIEMFVALRRLQKPVWLLNYNGEDHGLRQDHNQRDWAIRMQQFFDHFLQDAPPPVWLEEGVPGALKGKTLGLDLVTKPITEQEGSESR